MDAERNDTPLGDELPKEVVADLQSALRVADFPAEQVQRAQISAALLAAPSSAVSAAIPAAPRAFNKRWSRQRIASTTLAAAAAAAAVVAIGGQLLDSDTTHPSTAKAAATSTMLPEAKRSAAPSADEAAEPLADTIENGGAPGGFAAPKPELVSLGSFGDLGALRDALRARSTVTSAAPEVALSQTASTLAAGDAAASSAAAGAGATDSKAGSCSATTDPVFEASVAGEVLLVFANAEPGASGMWRILRESDCAPIELPTS